jgi:hypothetical protein
VTAPDKSNFDAWLPDDKPGEGALFGFDRSAPSVRFSAPYVPDSWLTTLRRRLGRWLLRGLNE